MSAAKSSKNEYKRKLRVEEYVLEIDRNDISGVEVTYCFDYVQSTIYKDGKKMEVIDKPIITIELSGKDREGNEAWICFDLKTDINYLNTLSKIPSDLSYLLCDSEAFIKIPSEELPTCLGFELSKNREDDIYKNFSSFWVSKVNDNEFIMKLYVPNEVFTYFKIIFEK